MRVESNLPNANLGKAPTTTVALSRPGFAQAMDKAIDQALPAQVKIIQSGETLTSIVREQAQQQGVKLSPSEEFRWTQALAADSGIKNPNAIFPGQRLQMQNMLASWQAGQTQPNNLASHNSSANGLTTQTGQPSQSATATGVANPKASTVSGLPKGTYINAVAHPVLSQTLDRAVSRGFIPKVEKQDVYNKVLQVANKHNFSPDDFARLTLMESDGMNPQASNNRCHGIIQFCDGPARGAAEVGFGKAPKQILGLSVYQQLHLVDTYFEKAGLKKESPVPLDELYLAVLHPAARGEKRPEEPLGIPGKQAKYLYEGRDPQAPMTRASITQGLMQNAVDRLGFSSFKHNQPGAQSNNAVSNAINQALNPAQDPTANAAARARLQVQKAADYDALEAPKVWLR
ncbi:LysM domain-containing protein [Limnohabitans sp. Rim11]|uniref:LysM peptidoglycan-binding domain-containing protein n=1 Tax=Limnohabitans sp. Rim11 TaxID=1100719 RepID=UPI000B0C534C|nr:LysM domain-containing protein [Limnohabitans sp. Rim11]